MSSLPSQMMLVACPACGTQLQVPAALAGKQGRCLRCQGVVDIPLSASAAYQPAMSGIGNDADEYRLSAPSQPTMPALDLSNYAPKDPPAAQYDGVFGVEKRGMDAGVLGGLGMMLLAVVWFFGGLAVGYIFWYPPVLFIIGLVACIRGAFSNS